MAESESRAGPSSKTPKERLFSNRNDRTKSPFGRAVYGIWPVKPALNLAQRAGITERHANYLIKGRSRPSAHVLHVVNAAMLGELE